MSVYIIEEPNESPVLKKSNGDEVVEYWRLYSPLQKKRFIKVIQELNKTWFNVYNQIKFMRDYSSINQEQSNNFMLKVHKLFIQLHKSEINYYTEEKLRLRRNKNYISKKIKKIKNTINKV